MLARGLTNYECALAYFAKRESNSGGRRCPATTPAGKRHLLRLHPTGGTLIPACGPAWSMRLAGSDGVCLATIGDAASRQGGVLRSSRFRRPGKAARRVRRGGQQVRHLDSYGSVPAL